MLNKRLRLHYMTYLTHNVVVLGGGASRTTNEALVEYEYQSRHPLAPKKRQQEMLNTKQTALALGFCENTIRVWANHGRLPFHHFTGGGQRRFDVSAFKPVEFNSTNLRIYGVRSRLLSRFQPQNKRIPTPTSPRASTTSAEALRGFWTKPTKEWPNPSRLRWLVWGVERDIGQQQDLYMHTMWRCSQYSS